MYPRPAQTRERGKARGNRDVHDEQELEHKVQNGAGTSGRQQEVNINDRRKETGERKTGRGMARNSGEDV